MKKYNKYNRYWNVIMYCLIFCALSPILASVHISFALFFVVALILILIFNLLANREAKKIIKNKYYMYSISDDEYTENKNIIGSTIYNFSVDKNVTYDTSNFEGYNLNSKFLEKDIITEIKKNDPEFSKAVFKQSAYVCLKKFFTALNEENINSLKPLLTDNMFETQKKLLEINKKNEIKNIVSDISPIYSYISNFKKNKNEYIIEIKISVTSKNYRLNKKNNANDIHQNNYTIKTYYMTFIKKLEGIRKKTEITDVECPNCGAPADTLTTNYCEYCKSYIPNKENDWLLNELTYFNKKEE